MPAADEQQLITEVQQGSHDAFRLLVERHMRQAYDVAFGILGNHYDADDATQESFLKAYRSMSSFRGASSFGTWLYRIVTNESLNRVKRNKRKQHREVQLEHAENKTVSHQMPSMTIDDTQRYLERALHELPTLQRAVVMLRHLNGLSTHQVSRILECSEGTVKTHLHRGLKKMRERLAYLKEDMA